ncbi:hypothetical protein HAHE_16330 [Haloferula helveola]|uniref:Immunity MXAN-0049 protein domain-containing protein n=1 Tax=Haloferula helveola TaxID=490095 RepID=A0ABM7RFB3_9BACT|nr:hypothetical protein HAHE_16330 [Haloferula helveola]
MAFQLIPDFEGECRFVDDWRSPSNSWNTVVPSNGVWIDSDYTSQFELAIGPGDFWPVFLLNPLSWPLFRKDFVDTSLELQRAIHRGDVQSLPILLNAAEKHPEYRLINVTRLVPCLDVQRSCISRFDDDPTEEISAVNRAVLRREASSDAPPVFRAREFPVMLFVQDAMAEELSACRELGAELVPVELS